MAAAPAPWTQDDARRRLIFALDAPTVSDASALVDALAGAVSFYKIGLELWAAGGSELAVRLARLGQDVFVDLKLHDIPETVARTTSILADMGATFTTLHGPPRAIEAAAKVKGDTKLLGVTVLTSMDLAEWRAAWGFGDGRSMEEVVRERARVLLESGCDGLVCSPLEVAALRAAHPRALLVTPGVRPAGAAQGDQKRVATPRAAIEAGASHLVVGRPIRDASDPRRAANDIVAEMAEATTVPGRDAG